MAKPAESSFAELMRNPLEILCREVDKDACVLSRFLCAFRELRFVLMTKATANPPSWFQQLAGKSLSGILCPIG